MEPVACTLGSSELGSQVDRWKRLYAEAGFGRTETDHGVRVQFRRGPGVEQELTALVAVERECCKWAGWTVEGDEDDLILEIASTGDGVSVIHTWFQEEEPVVPATAR
ncbi:MAG TPA: hypothetical protein VI142_02720 [Gaiellaceae bacterium]